MEAKLNVFYEDLITSLPMEDAIFIAKLQKSNLFPGNLKATVKSKIHQQMLLSFFGANCLQGLKKWQGRFFEKFVVSDG